MRPNLLIQTIYTMGWYEYLITSLSFLLCLVIVLLSSRVLRLCGRTDDLTAVQAMHLVQTPRLGGIAIFGTLCLSVVLVSVSLSWVNVNLIIATSLIFFIGIAEDIGIRMSPAKRMLAVVCSSLLVIWSSGVWLPRTGIPMLDIAAEHWIVGIPITVLVMAGISNGFNLVDGVNGLASFVGIVTTVALSQIAEISGYEAMVHYLILFASGIFGFFLLNYPFGLIFLGDAGAYTIGFVLSWCGIAILVNEPDVSAWAILLTFFWPIADTLLAIFRRLNRKTDLTVPDRLHFHQMVMRALEICFLGRTRRHISNPLTTLILAPFVIMPPLVGVKLWDQDSYAFLAALIFSIMFFVVYIFSGFFVRKYRLRSS